MPSGAPSGDGWLLLSISLQLLAPISILGSLRAAVCRNGVVDLGENGPGHPRVGERGLLHRRRGMNPATSPNWRTGSYEFVPCRRS
jgi:hypothetical protein